MQVASSCEIARKQWEVKTVMNLLLKERCIDSGESNFWLLKWKYVQVQGLINLTENWSLFVTRHSEISQSLTLTVYNSNIYWFWECVPCGIWILVIIMTWVNDWWQQLWITKNGLLLKHTKFCNFHVCVKRGVNMKLSMSRAIPFFHWGKLCNNHKNTLYVHQLIW